MCGVYLNTYITTISTTITLMKEGYVVLVCRTFQLLNLVAHNLELLLELCDLILRLQKTLRIVIAVSPYGLVELLLLLKLVLYNVNVINVRFRALVRYRILK